MSYEDRKIPIYFAKTGEIKLVDRIEKTDEEWMKELSPESYDVARKQGTELPFTGKYHDCHENGIPVCMLSY
jgi:peptide-methionine (R)-S-oxide reductase